MPSWSLLFLHFFGGVCVGSLAVQCLSVMLRSSQGLKCSCDLLFGHKIENEFATSAATRHSQFRNDNRDGLAVMLALALIGDGDPSNLPAATARAVPRK